MQQQVRSRAGYLGELGVGFRPLPQTPPSFQPISTRRKASREVAAPKRRMGVPVAVARSTGSACATSLSLGKLMMMRSASKPCSRRTTAGSAMLSHQSVVTEEPCVQRTEEHKSELQSLMRISYAVFCLKKKK